MDVRSARFPSPVLDEQARELYGTLYGEQGEKYTEILDQSPDEIAVISLLIAYLTKGKE